ncbi:MAG: hypothetical protein PHW73_00255 [Atribacterota bacterium]|nr:hypothetical protein [Atribacterota bacterium]
MSTITTTTTDSLNLSESQKERINNLLLIESGAGLTGLILGIIYSSRTGGGFWRGVGYSILGALIFGVPARIITTPFKNKIIKEPVNIPPTPKKSNG